jgi:DNA (cytosine-5)-methyltransferase 1
VNKLSLFSGIGGDDIASEACGIKTVCMCEIDKDCRKVLRHHFPGIPIIKDVKDVTAETVCNPAELFINGGDNQQETSGTSIPELRDADCKGNIFRGGIDIISGGFPCQPHSVAGKHLGSADERDLWGEFRRIIGEIKPRWVVAENVPGLFSTDAGRFFRGILSDLSEMGYSAGWCTFGAVDVGAWHRRDRVFIVAYDNFRQSRPGIESEPIRETQFQPCSDRRIIRKEDATDSASGRCPQCNTEIGQPSESDSDGDVPNPISQRGCGWNATREYAENVGELRGSEGTRGRQFESRMGNLVDGLSQWLAEPDGVPRVATGIKARVAKLKALGNAVVPAQVYQVYKAIVEIEAGLL